MPTALEATGSRHHQLEARTRHLAGAEAAAAAVELQQQQASAFPKHPTPPHPLFRAPTSSRASASTARRRTASLSASCHPTPHPPTPIPTINSTCPHHTTRAQSGPAGGRRLPGRRHHRWPIGTGCPVRAANLAYQSRSTNGRVAETGCPVRAAKNGLGVALTLPLFAFPSAPKA